MLPYVKSEPTLAQLWVFPRCLIPGSQGEKFSTCLFRSPPQEADFNSSKFLSKAEEELMSGSNSEFQSKAGKRMTHRKKKSIGHGMMLHNAQWTENKEGKNGQNQVQDFFGDVKLWCAFCRQAKREDFGYRNSLEFYLAVPCASWHCCATGIGSRSVCCC